MRIRNEAGRQLRRAVIGGQRIVEHRNGVDTAQIAQLGHENGGVHLRPTREAAAPDRIAARLRIHDAQARIEIAGGVIIAQPGPVRCAHHQRGIGVGLHGDVEVELVIGVVIDPEVGRLVDIAPAHAVGEAGIDFTAGANRNGARIAGEAGPQVQRTGRGGHGGIRRPRERVGVMEAELGNVQHGRLVAGAGPVGADEDGIGARLRVLELDARIETDTGAVIIAGPVPVRSLDRQHGIHIRRCGDVEIEHIPGGVVEIVRRLVGYVAVAIITDIAGIDGTARAHGDGGRILGETGIQTGRAIGRRGTGILGRSTGSQREAKSGTTEIAKFGHASPPKERGNIPALFPVDCIPKLLA